MATTTKTQRRRAHRKAVDSSAICIKLKDGMGRLSRITADVVDVIDGGFGVNLRTPLRSGSAVIVGEHLEAEVRWCVAKPDGTFRAGLEFLGGYSAAVDCYEVMQLSPLADPETIARVYRMLAARYHPDNLATGNSEKFIQLSDAHQILSDPEKRKTYDVRLRELRQLRQQIFDRVALSAERGEQVQTRVAASVGSLSGWNAALRQPGF